MSPSRNPYSSQDTLILHATTVAMAGQAALFKGPSGSGKSGLALQLLALGAVLVADDRTCLCRREGSLVAMAPKALKNKIEARYVGLLNVPSTVSAPLALVVDLAKEEKERLPVPRCETLLGLSVPVIRKSNTPHFPAAVALYLQGGRFDWDD